MPVGDGRALAPWTGAAAVVGAGPTGFFAVFGVELLRLRRSVLLGDGFCVDVVLLGLVVLLELVGLLDVVVLELLDVDGCGRGGGLRRGRRRRRRGRHLVVAHPGAGGKSTVLVPFRAPSMNAVQIFTGNVPPVSSPKPAMFCIGLGLPLTSL